MKQKIFDKLKQAYSSLGLGDAILQAHSESLAALGLVTDDNIEAVISAQKGFLESLQKQNDKRVTDAVASAGAKAKNEFDKEKKELLSRIEQLQKGDDNHTEPAIVNSTDIPEWYKAEQEKAKKERESLNEQLATLLRTNQELSVGLSNLQNENEAMKKAAATKAKRESIIAKAKELGIPQYRIDEGFVIADDADDSAITEILTKVSNNIKASQLAPAPSFTLSEEAPSKEEVSNLAKMLIQ